MKSFFSNSKKIEPREYSEDEFIELRSIGFGSVFIVELAYLIESEELVAIKKPNVLDREVPKLIQREKHNYSKLNHPLIPKLYGTLIRNDSLIVEYINGYTLNDVDKFNLSFDDKIMIIFEIMIIIFIKKN